MRLHIRGLALILFCLSITIVSYTQSFPTVKEFVTPPYPPAAQAVGADGDVQIGVEVDRDGKVINASAISGHKLLIATARQVALKWTFSPGTGGHFLTLRFRFRLSNSKKYSTAHLVGNYTLKFIEPQSRIVTTVSYESNDSPK